MSKVAFTLIEVLLVVILIAITTMLFLSFKTTKQSLKIEDLKEILYPNGIIYFFADNTNLVIKDKNFSINLKLNEPTIYIYKKGEFKIKHFKIFNNKKVIFKYQVKRGLSKAFILKNNNIYYVFKPLFIKKFKNFENAKNFYLLPQYQLKKLN